jgi:hypothetical protein
MHADGGVEIRVGHPHDGGGGPSGGKARDMDAPGIDGIVAHDLPGDAGDQRRLSPLPLLVGRAEPVPAFGVVGRRRLCGIDDQPAMLLRHHVHARPGGEIVGRLRAAMQHDHEGKRPYAVMGARDVQLVAPASGPVAEAAIHELPAFRHDAGPV